MSALLLPGDLVPDAATQSSQLSRASSSLPFRLANGREETNFRLRRGRARVSPRHARELLVVYRVGPKGTRTSRVMNVWWLRLHPSQSNMGFQCVIHCPERTYGQFCESNAPSREARGLFKSAVLATARGK